MDQTSNFCHFINTPLWCFSRRPESSLLKLLKLALDRRVAGTTSLACILDSPTRRKRVTCNHVGLETLSNPITSSVPFSFLLATKNMSPGIHLPILEVVHNFSYEKGFLERKGEGCQASAQHPFCRLSGIVRELLVERVGRER